MLWRSKGEIMRFINSLRNSSFAFVGQVVTILMGFAVRWFFIHRLGQEYLGVNSVMESMLTILSMTELGIGTSVAFALYKPIDDGDKKRIGSLMAFYRKVYFIIGIATAVVGPMLIPFMRIFTREAAEVANVNLIYLLFLSNTVLSYFFAYKRTLLSAYQQNYVNSVTEDTFAILKYILQTVAIIIFESYIGYLVINIICTFATNIVIGIVCDRRYPFIKKYKEEKLLKEDRDKLKKSIVSLMYQKIGAKLVTGTDNLMISYAKLTLMGIYSNYSMVVSTVSRIVYNVLCSVMGSIGNLMIQKDDNHKYNVFEEFVFATFLFYFFIAIGFSACLERFIVLWADETWLLAPSVTFVVVMNFFLTGLRQPNIVVIEAAGLFNRLRMKAVGEVIVNLAISFLFLIVFKMGIYGVLLGTTVSMVSICIWWEVLAVHRYALHASVKKYYLNYLLQLAAAACGCFPAYFAAKLIPVSGIAGLMLSGLTAIVLFAVVVLLFFGRSRVLRALIQRFRLRF